MTLRSVIDIDVKDEKFQAFLQTFGKYQKAIAAANVGWKEAEVAAGAAALASAEITEELKKQEKAQAKAEAAAKKAAKEEAQRLANARKEIDKINKTVRDIGSGLLSATESLLKWIGIGGVLSGLAGAGGLWGLDALAGSIGNARRSAQGLGVTSGQQQAFGINYGRYVDANANLSSIAEAKSNLSDRWAFYAMGVNPNGKDPAQLAVEMAARAKDIWGRGNGTEQYAQAHGLSQFYSLEDLRRLGATSSADLAASASAYGRDARNLNMSDASQKGWQDFTVQMSLASQKIKNLIGEALVPLEPQLKDLSAAVVTTINAFVHNPHMKEWIDELADGIKNLGAYLTSDKFQADLKTFIDDFDAVTKAIVAGLKVLGVIPAGPADAMSSGGGAIPVAAGAAAGGAIGSLWGPAGTVVGGALGAGVGAMWGGAQKSRLVQFDHDYGLPPGALEAIYGLESGYGKHAGRSSAGALGPFQFEPGAASQYGVSDRSSFYDSSLGAAKYMRDLMREFKGDFAKSLAAYNWGQGHVEADVKAHGAAWLQYAPRETQQYVSRGLKLTVNNNTGGNANVTANQAAAGH